MVALARRKRGGKIEERKRRGLACAVRAGIASAQNLFQRFELRAVGLGQPLRIAADAAGDGRCRQQLVGLADSGAQRMKERIGSSLGMGADFERAARRKARGQRLAGFARALVGVGDDPDLRRIRAAVGRKQSLRGQQLAVVCAEERHQLRAVLGQVARRNAPRGPRLAGVLIQLVGLAGGRAHSVAADDDHELQLLIGAFAATLCLQSAASA